MPDHAHAGAVEIHARCETADPHEAVVGFGARDFAWIPAEITRVAAAVVRVVSAADAEGLARLVGEHRAAVAGVPIELAVRPDRDAVQRVIVGAAVEAGENHFALVHGGVELSVTVHIRVDDEVRRHRDDDLIVDHADAHRRVEERLLHERPRLVRHAVAIGVLKHNDAVAGGLAVAFAAIVHALGDPDAAILVCVDVRRIFQLRRRGPHGDFQLGVGELEQIGRHQRGHGRGIGGASGRKQIHHRRHEEEQTSQLHPRD